MAGLRVHIQFIIQKIIYVIRKPAACFHYSRLPKMMHGNSHKISKYYRYDKSLVKKVIHRKYVNNISMLAILC